LKDLEDDRRPAAVTLFPSVSLPPTGPRAANDPEPPHVTGSLPIGRPPTSTYPLHTTEPESGALSTSTRPPLESVQKLPKYFSTVEKVLGAWYSVVDGTFPMKDFVVKKHPTLKLDR